MLFINIEGNDGAGKTTLAKNLKKYFYKKIKCFLTYEPGGSNYKNNKLFRNILLNSKYNPKTELLIYMLNRNEHIKNTINKAMNNYDIIICDRFIYSSVVYQGYLGNLGMDWVLKINKEFFNKFMPDLVFVILINPSLIKKRIQKRKTLKNKYDKMGEEKQRIIYDGYKKICQDNKNIFLINGNQLEKTITKKVIKIIKKYYKNAHSKNI